MGLFDLFKKRELEKKESAVMGFVMNPGVPRWTPRNYENFAKDAYNSNVIANMCIRRLSENAAAIPLVVTLNDEKVDNPNDPLVKLLQRPSPDYEGGKAFTRKVLSFLLIAGNAYVEANRPSAKQPPMELYCLRPDRMKVIPMRDGFIEYKYQIEGFQKTFRREPDGFMPILHLKEFNPTNDYYGLSRVEPAAYSIDQHNEAGNYNKSLLQNGARPSGALVFEQNEIRGELSDDQFQRLQEQINREYAGSSNAGKPLLLEGGMTWQEMGLSPRDMDFENLKNSAARDIALAFGVPPQLLGIPGDSTYSNVEEARQAFYEQSVIPLLHNYVESLNNWIVPLFGDGYKIIIDETKITALQPRRESMQEMALAGVREGVLTINEAREAFIKPPLDEGGDDVMIPLNKIPLSDDVIAQEQASIDLELESKGNDEIASLAYGDQPDS